MSDTIKINEHRYEGAIASLEFILDAIQAINDQRDVEEFDPLYFTLKNVLNEFNKAAKVED